MQGAGAVFGRDHYKRKDYRLPAIMPVVLHNGERNWTASCSFSQMIDHAELMYRIRAMEPNDVNEWITWFSNVIRELNEKERGELIDQLKKEMRRVCVVHLKDC